MSEANEQRLFAEENPYVSPATGSDQLPTQATLSVWFVGSLVLATLVGSTIAGIRTDSWEVNGAKDLLRSVSNLTYGALTGLGTVLLLRIAIWRELRTMPPGYWFALNALPTALAYLIAMWWDSFSMFELHELVHLNTQQALRAGLFIVMALTTRAGGFWKGYAWTRVTFSLAVLLHSAIDLAAAATVDENMFRASTVVALMCGLIQLALPVAFLTAIVNDFYRGNRRNLVHWACIGLHVAFELNHLIQLFRS